MFFRLRCAHLCLAISAVLLSGQPAFAAPVGGEFQANTTIDDTKNGCVAMNSSGVFVVVWENKIDKHVWARRYDASGTAIGNPLQISTSTDEDGSPSVGLADGGGFVVVWECKPSIGNRDIFARQYDSSGNATGSASQVSASSGDHDNPDIAMTPDGRFVVVWDQDAGGTDKDVYARLYNASANAKGNPFQVSPSSDEHKKPAVAMADDGAFVVVWERKTSLGAKDIFARRYKSSGSALGSSFQVNASGGDHKKPNVAVAADGSFVVAWENKLQAATYAKRYDASGGALGNSFSVGGSGVSPLAVGKGIGVASTGDGGFVVTWQNHADDNVYAHQYDASGTALDVEFQVNTTGFENKDTNVSANGEGGFVIVWENKNGKDIKGQLYGGSTQKKILHWAEIINKTP